MSCIQECMNIVYQVLVYFMFIQLSAQISSTNQLLVTLAGGLIPFFVRFVLNPSRGGLDPGEYAFEAKVHHLLKTLTQFWPVHDITFTFSPDQSEGPAQTPGHVDLMFTVRDSAEATLTSNLLRNDDMSNSLDVSDSVRALKGSLCSGTIGLEIPSSAGESVAVAMASVKGDSDLNNAEKKEFINDDIELQRLKEK